jgi:hypothetical protein
MKRAVSTATALSLGLAALVGAAAPAHAALPSTSFKIHLNVPAEVAADWNIWYWATGDEAVGPSDNTLGELTKTVGGEQVTKDWTPNFVGEDAYGAYAEFTLPVTLTALSNVLRTTESWDGQAAAPEVPAVLDDPLTLDDDESQDAIPAKPAIPASDKPLGGDNSFPAGESWWNVHTGLREFPLTKTSEFKVYMNTSLKTAQSQGWNVYSFNSANAPRGLVAPTKLADYSVTTTTSKVVSSRVKVKGKWTTVKKTVKTTVKTYPYKGKVGAAVTGHPFVGEDKYGAYAIIKTSKVYAGDVGMVLRRSSPTNEWAKQSGDYKNVGGLTNGLRSSSSAIYLALGSSDVYYSVPTFVGRWGATATWANGQLTVTPVRPAHPSMRGMAPTKIVVTAKRGSTTLTCTIATKALATAIDSSAWALDSSCSMPAAAPSAPDTHTWEITISTSAPNVGTSLPGVTPAAKVEVLPAG